MNTKQTGAISDLLEQGRELLHATRKTVQFTEDDTADRYLNHIENHPHLCSSWVALSMADPVSPGLEIGGFEFKMFEEASVSDFQRVFAENKLHGFNNVAALHFYVAVRRIETQYEGDVSKVPDSRRS